MKPARFLLPAEQEMLEAALYYESEAAGLAEDFSNKIESAVLDIRENPARWPVLRQGVRRPFNHRYPYCLLYREEANEVLVLAVMHLHRHP